MKDSSKTPKRQHIKPGLILGLLLLLFASPVFAQDFTPERKLASAQMIIDRFYVEPVDNDTVVTEAIKAMLKTLDPHSAYTSAADTKEFTEPLEGKFSGIGVSFNMLEDTVYVIQTVSGGPSQKVGIMPGDRIIAAGDSILAGRKLANRAVMKQLRGPKGSLVTLKVKRGDEIIEFDVVRDEIPIYSIDETFMADPTTGYIRVSRFAEDTPRELREALAKLKAQGMKNLILDLQGNGGGYLGAAAEMAEEFLPQGSQIVSTAGRAFPAQNYASERRGSFLDGKLVVITDQHSASAAEILSGAIQDNDRGVIVGRRTFGKGLVQRPFPFPDGSMIRLTIARYYTPSGRCIQKHYEKGHGEEYQLEMLNRYKAGELWSADSIARPDSLKYYTLKSHRPVYGGGGIIPDVFVPVDTTHYSAYYRDLIAKALVNRAAVNYVEKNRASLLKQYPDDAAFEAKFTVPQSLLDDLIERGDKAGIKFNQEQWERSMPYIKGILSGLIARDLYEKASYFKHLAPLNKEYIRALEVINDENLYRKTLSGK